jgi:hypothetical protein
MIGRLLFAVLFILPLAAYADSAFGPGGNTVSLAVTGTTGRVSYQATPTHPNVRIYNSGTVAAFVACGDVNIVATTGSGMPVAPGTVEVIGCGQTYIAAITASGTATIYLTPGTGI